MVKYICDRCGAELEPDLTFISTAFVPSSLEIKIKVKAPYKPEKAIDLCRNCKELFYEWLSDRNESSQLSTKE